MSFLCCSKANKVEDDKPTVLVHNGSNTVFVFVSANIVSQCLLGPFIQALETKGLAPSKIVFRSGASTDFSKSNLFKNNHKSPKFNHLGVFMVWTGENVYGRMTEVVHRFGNQHTIPKMDILYTTSPIETKKETDLWFEKEQTLNKSPELVPVEAARPDVAEEAAPTVEPSSEVPPVHPEEPVPAYEDAATAEVEDIAAEHEAVHEEQK